MKKSYINNMVLNNERRNTTYQAVLIDLYLCGALPKEVVEGLTGTELIENIKLPEHVEKFIIEQSEQNADTPIDPANPDTPVEPDPAQVGNAITDDDVPEEQEDTDLNDPELED